MCFEPFGIDFNFDGKVDFFEQVLTYEIMEDALSDKEDNENDWSDDSWVDE